MIKGKTVYYGFGDIYNDCSGYNELIFNSIEPSQEIGTSVNVLHSKIVHSLSVALTYEELCKLENELNALHQAEIIKVKNITLDFTNFNQKSVNAVLNSVEYLITNQLFLMAC
jgi:hypothetical protein